MRTAECSQRPVALAVVTVSADGKIADTLRGVAAAVCRDRTPAAAPARPGDRGGASRRRWQLTLLVPLPTAVQLRDWARSLGPWFPAAFLVAHIVVTVLPFPRTAFTLAAGLLFGPALGVLLAVAASTASAVIAVLLVRTAGWQLSRLVRHRAVETLDARLRERGWPTVLSLRLIPAVPFSVLNYAAGASAVRVWPYTLATLVGLAPGHRRGGDSRRRADRPRRPVVAGGLAVHRRSRGSCAGVRGQAAPPRPAPAAGNRRGR